MNSLLLKIIGVLIIITDYVGLLYFNNNPFLRFIGMMAFPLYGFLLVESYIHIKDNPKRLFKYMISILLLALLTEPIYDKLYFGNYFVISSQNVIFTLFISLICMIINDKLIKKIDKIVSFLVVVYFAIFSMLFNSYYGLFGILLIFTYYLIINSSIKIRKKYMLLLFADIVYIAIKYLLSGGNLIYLGIIPSLILIILYNGKRGFKSNFIKYIFYIFYPLFLLILLLMM